MQQNRSRTVQLALIVAGLIGLAMLLDKILQTTGKLAQETVASTAETMRSAVEGAIQAAVPTEMVPQHKTIEAIFAVLTEEQKQHLKDIIVCLSEKTEELQHERDKAEAEAAAPVRSLHAVG